MNSRRRVIRAMRWALVGATGIVLGLLFGARSAGVSPDIPMLAGIAMVAAGIGSITGLLWPLTPAPIETAQSDPKVCARESGQGLDLREPAIDLRSGAGGAVPAARRRDRPMRPRTPPR